MLMSHSHNCYFLSITKGVLNGWKSGKKILSILLHFPKYLSCCVDIKAILDAGAMPWVVEQLPRKHEVLSSNPSAAEKIMNNRPSHVFSIAAVCSECVILLLIVILLRAVTFPWVHREIQSCSTRTRLCCRHVPRSNLIIPVKFLSLLLFSSVVTFIMQVVGQTLGRSWTCDWNHNGLSL
jgi:hypothetical protein